MESMCVLFGLTGQLKATYDYCVTLKDNHQLHLRVYNRLEELFTELQRHEKRGVDLTSSDVLRKYRGLLHDFHHFLKGQQNKKFAYRIFSQREICARVQQFHEDIDQFFRILTVAMGAEIVDFKQQFVEWKIQYQQDVAEQWARFNVLATDHVTLLQELNTNQKKREAISVWKKTLSQQDKADPGYRIVDQAYNTLLRHSKQVNVSKLEPWFVHEGEIEIDERPIGCGAFGEVFLGYYEEHTQIVVKRLIGTSDRLRQDFRNEIQSWWSVNHHQFVLKMFGACDVSDPPFIVCEYALHGSLESFLGGDDANSTHLWRLLYEAAQGVSFLHKQKMIHGDIKCNNILVAKDGHARIADFGMSFTRANSSTLSKKKQTGAVRWKAPECIEGENPTFASDWYAFGMCILEAVSGRVPWANVADEIIVMDNVRRGKLPPRPANVSDDAWNLISLMCKTDPMQRLTGRDVLSKLRGLAKTEDDGIDALTTCRFSSNSSSQTDELPPSSKSSSSSNSTNQTNELPPSPKSSLPQKETPQFAPRESAWDVEDNQVDIAEAGAIPSVVQLLTSGTDKQKEYAARALADAADVEISRVQIADAGGIPPLVELIATGTVMQKEYAALALGKIACDVEENQVKINEAGAISPLVKLIATGTDAQKVNSTVALVKIAKMEINRVQIADAGGIAPLVQLLTTGTVDQRKHAALALGVIGSSVEANQVKIGEAGGIPPLVELTATGTDAQKEDAAWALFQIANMYVNKVMIGEAGGIPPLVKLIASGTDDQKTWAVAALSNIAHAGVTRFDIALAGGIPPLIKLIASGTDEQKVFAARLLARVSDVESNCVKIVEAGGIPPLVELVASGTDEQKVRLAYALGNIADVKVNRLKIAEAGGIPPLVTLIASGTDEQKLWAALALGTIARDEQVNRNKIVQAGGIPPLLNMVAYGTRDQQNYACYAVASLAADRDVAKRLKKNGAVEMMKLMTHDSAKNTLNTIKRNTSWVFGQ